MKLKALFEGPSTYMGAGGQRYGAWEEPDDQSDGPDEVKKELVIPYSLADNTPVKLKVAVTYQQYGTDIQLHTVEPVALILPSGKEVDIEVARQQFGDDDQFAAPEVFDWTAEYMQTEMGQKVDYDVPKPQQAAPVAPQGNSMMQAPSKVGAVTI